MHRPSLCLRIQDDRDFEDRDPVVQPSVSMMRDFFLGLNLRAS